MRKTRLWFFLLSVHIVHTQLSVSARLAGLSALLLHDLLPKVVKMVEEEEDGASAEPNHHGAICLMKNCQKAASSIT